MCEVLRRTTTNQSIAILPTVATEYSTRSSYGVIPVKQEPRNVLFGSALLRASVGCSATRIQSRTTPHSRRPSYGRCRNGSGSRCGTVQCTARQGSCHLPGDLPGGAGGGGGYRTNGGGAADADGGLGGGLANFEAAGAVTDDTAKVVAPLVPDRAEFVRCVSLSPP